MSKTAVAFLSAVLLTACLSDTPLSAPEQPARLDAEAVVAANIIMIDGLPHDWSGVPAILAPTGSQLHSLRLTNDASHLYFLLEISPAVWGTSGVMNVSLDLDNNSATGCSLTTRGTEAVLSVWRTLSGWSVVLSGPGGTQADPCFFAGTGVYFDLATSTSHVEFAVPITALRRIGVQNTFAVSVTPPSESPLPSRGVYTFDGTPLVCATGVALQTQGDPQWGNEHLDSTTELMRHSGCVVTSVAMGLTVSAWQWTAGALNRNLTLVAGAFDGGGGLRWDIAARGVSGARRVFMPIRSFSEMDASLCAGYPVIVKQAGRGHFFVVGGKDSSGNYRVQDPDGGTLTVISPSQIGEFRGAIVPGGFTNQVSAMTLQPALLTLSADSAWLLIEYEGLRSGLTSNGTTVGQIPGMDVWEDVIDHPVTGQRLLHSTYIRWDNAPFGSPIIHVTPLKTGEGAVLVQMAAIVGAAPLRIGYVGSPGTTLRFRLEVAAGGTISATRVPASALSLRSTVEATRTLGLIRPFGLGQALLAHINAAESAYNRGQLTAARHALLALEAHVLAQSGRGVAEEVAIVLVEESAALRGTWGM